MSESKPNLGDVSLRDYGAMTGQPVDEVIPCRGRQQLFDVLDPQEAARA